MKTLEITSYVACPNECSYCPQALLLRCYKGKGTMTLEDFGKLLNNVPKDVKIDFSGFSEIFIHSEGSAMIRLAYDQGYNVTLYTTLVGLLTKDLDLLKGVWFKEVVFHMYEGVNMSEFNQDREIFSRVVQSGRITTIRGNRLWSRAGNLFDRITTHGSFICESAKRDFDHNVVMPNGDVYICCMDYGLKHKIGNLFETNFNDLNRKELIDLSLRADSEIICRKCELLKIC